MRFSTELVLAACVSAAMAGPHHMHRHRDVHAKKSVDWEALDWNNMGIDWAAAWSRGQETATTSIAQPTSTPATTPTATASPIIAVAKPETTAVAPSSTSQAAASTPSSAVDSIIGDVETLFSSIVGMADKITKFGEASVSTGSEVGATGNIGIPEASNMMKVSSPEGYDFTNTFVNTQSVAKTIVVWNKAATSSSGVVEPNLGSCLALTKPALSITLAPGGKQTVAFMDGSLIGWAEATKATTASGAPDTTWGEASFKKEGSGFDVSSIVNSAGNNYDMSITVSENSCVSDMTQNDWIAGPGGENDPVPVGGSDGSCYVPGSSMTLTTKMGGTV